MGHWPTLPHESRVLTRRFSEQSPFSSMAPRSPGSALLVTALPSSQRLTPGAHGPGRARALAGRRRDARGSGVPGRGAGAARRLARGPGGSRAPRWGVRHARAAQEALRRGDVAEAVDVTTAVVEHVEDPPSQVGEGPLSSRREAPVQAEHARGAI